MAEAAVREIVTRKRMMVFSGTAHPTLAEEIAHHLGIRLSEARISRFASGEIYFRAAESVRGCDVFVVQSHASPINESIMEQLIMIDALKRASAKRITAVVPYYGYSRQDKKALAREPISARLVADLLSVAGADRVVSVDLHSGQIQGFFPFPVDHLTALPILGDYFKDELRLGRDVVVVAPDAGRVRTAERLARHLHCTLAFIHKRRSPYEAHKIEAIDVIGKVEGRPCILIDDMIDTAGTIAEGAQALAAEGAAEIYAAATHPVLSGKAVQRIAESPIKQTVVTNTLPVPEEKAQVLGDRLTVLSIAPLVAAALKAVFEDESVSEIFHGENQP
ncbi:MAG TPA: ribose-phosphate diphosphokinase [Actinomycetota bacterium]|nr:ribose-phosphate diphosphokinase [Actinomycetota bacterium]